MSLVRLSAGSRLSADFSLQALTVVGAKLGRQPEKQNRLLVGLGLGLSLSLSFFRQGYGAGV